MNRVVLLFAVLAVSTSTMVGQEPERQASDEVTRRIMKSVMAYFTEDTAPALVCFADGQTRQWQMVRVEE